MLIKGPGSPGLCERLEVSESVEVKSRVFPDGEIYVRLEGNVTGEDCVLVQTTYPNKHLIEMLFWTGGLWAIGGTPDITRAVFATLAVLVMGYPCALGMATPLAIIRGGGVAAARGIIMRSGEAFQIFPRQPGFFLRSGL